MAGDSWEMFTATVRPVAPADLPDADATCAEPEPERSLEQLASTAGRAAASVVLATSLTAALAEPPRAELVELPAAEPIVRSIESLEGEADAPPEDAAQEASRSSWRDRARRLLRFLVTALIALALFLGTLASGCAKGLAGALFPNDQEEERTEQVATP